MHKLFLDFLIAQLNHFFYGSIDQIDQRACSGKLILMDTYSIQSGKLSLKIVTA